MITDRILPVTQVKRELMKLLNTMQTEGGIVAITKDGRAAGVLMSAEEYEGFVETLEIMHDPALLRSLTKALKQSRQHKTIPHREVFKK